MHTLYTYMWSIYIWIYMWIYIWSIYIYEYICEYIYEVYIYMKPKAFWLHLIKSWERTSERKRRDGGIGKHKPNEMGAMNMK